MKKTIYAMAAAIALAACSPRPKAGTWAREGEEIRISMPANPSTGYRWKLLGNDICDSAGFEYAQDVRPGDEGRLICGRGGTATYILKARPSEGLFSPSERTDTIEFALSRGGEAPVEKRKYIIGFRK